MGGYSGIEMVPWVPLNRQAKEYDVHSQLQAIDATVCASDR